MNISNLKIFRNGRTNFLLLVLYGLMALPFLSPMSSNTQWSYTGNDDLYTYLQLIDQAKKGIEEGQFPLRIAPERYYGWRYPIFQFYAPLTFTMAGYLQLIISPDNPLIPFKILMWLAMVLAGFGAYKLAHYLFRSKGAAIIGGAVCLTAPWMMVNMHVRYQMQECLSAGLLPLAIYFLIRSFLAGRLFIVWAALAWSALLHTYGLTFLWGGLFAGGLLCTWSNLKIKTWFRWRRVIVAGAIGLLLSAWYFIPIAIWSKYLEFEMPKNTLTPLSFDLAPPLSHILAPLPIPYMSPGMKLFFSYRIGWPVFCAVAVVVASFFTGVRHRSIYSKNMLRLVALFGVAFFLAWTPFPRFWAYMPGALQKILPFRLLLHVMWLGAVLAACAMIILFRSGIKSAHVVVGLFMVGWIGATALPTDRVSSLDQKTSLQPVSKTIGMEFNKDFNNNRGPAPFNDWELYGGFLMNRYMYATNEIFSNVPTPLLIDYFGWLVTEPIPDVERYMLPCVNRPIVKYARQHGWLIDDEYVLPLPKGGERPTAIRLVGGIPAQESTNLVTLKVVINGSESARAVLEPGRNYNLKLPIIHIGYGDKSFRLKFDTDRYFAMRKPNEIADNMGRDKTIFYVQQLSFEGLPTSQCVMPVHDVQKYCAVAGAVTRCQIYVDANANVVQLPVIYFPDMIDLEVDGRKHDYFPTFQWPYFWLTSVRLPPGPHTITAQFVGMRWANWVSGVAWIAGLLAMGVWIFKRGRKGATRRMFRL